LLSLVAVRCRSDSYVFLNDSLDMLNTLLLVLGSWFSMAISWFEIGRMRELLPFSAVMYIVLRSRSMWCHSSLSSSPVLAPVSLRICSRVAVLGCPADIRLFSSCSVGMKGSWFSCWYCGLVHVLPKYRKYAV